MDEDQVYLDLGDMDWRNLTILVIGMFILAGGVGWGILIASRRPPPTMLVMALSMLTLMSVVAFVVTRSKEFGTLVGVGMGALASAVNTLFKNGDGTSKMSVTEVENPGPPTGSDPG